MSSRKKDSALLGTIKWIARILGSLVALMVLVFGVGYAIQGSAPTGPAIIVFAFWIIGVVAAWKWEGFGGSLILANTLACTLLPYDIIWPPNPLIVFPFCGVLFCIYWLATQAKTT